MKTKCFVMEVTMTKILQSKRTINRKMSMQYMKYGKPTEYHSSPVGKMV